jgi:hypothetical protein
MHGLVITKTIAGAVAACSGGRSATTRGRLDRGPGEAGGGPATDKEAPAVPSSSEEISTWGEATLGSACGGTGTTKRRLSYLCRVQVEGGGGEDAPTAGR